MSARLSPDVVVMDIRMPFLDGVGATRIVTRRAGAPRVLVLTTFEVDEYVVEALRAGASGFLLKDATPEELVQAVRVVAAGEALLSPRSPAGCSTGTRPASPGRPTVPARGRWRASPRASCPSSAWWPRDCPTRRSARSCTSPSAA